MAARLAYFAKGFPGRRVSRRLLAAKVAGGKITMAEVDTGNCCKWEARG